MKNIFILIFVVFASPSVIAQAPPPQAFNYQGIARDGSGAPLTNRTISLRLTVLQGGIGSVVYQETHLVTTSKLGVFSVEVGNGSSQLGQLEDIDWGIGEHSIQTELDPDGGTNYTLLGSSQLLSVPYALYAGHVAETNNYWQENGFGLNYMNGNVGIGTSTPDRKLTVEGTNPTGDSRIYASFNNQSTSNRSVAIVEISAGERNSSTTLQHFAETYDFDGDVYTDFGVVASSGRGMIMRADAPEGVLKFMTTGEETFPAERMRITAPGNVGIGTPDPVARLQVTDGDVYIEDINKGVIMKSPDGHCWRMTINNDGTINTASILCPN